MDGGQLSFFAPEGCYLATRYRDRQRDFVTYRHYYEDGRVMAFDGVAWWGVCYFSADEIAQAKLLIGESGVMTMSDILPSEKMWDTAELIYSWRLGEKVGRVVNRAYPAQQSAEVTWLTEQLDWLEVGARPYDDEGGDLK